MRLVLALLTGLFAYAQEFNDNWRTLAAANPSGATLTLRVAEPHRFHVGELIPVDVELHDSKMGAERMYSFGGVLIPASSSCGSRSKPCYVQNSQAMIPGELTKFGKSEEVLHGELNLYVPPFTFGHHRVAILADCFVLMADCFVLMKGKVKGAYYGPSKAVSNVEEFEIVPATAEWVTQTVAGASSELAG